MKRALLGLVAASIALSPALARDRDPGRGYANPSAVIAAEIAFAKLAAEKGQWTAFRATATKDAVMFEPHMVLAQDWLKTRIDPPKSVAWQPHQVWSSCDGSYAVTRGAWQREGSTGYFTTVWQRQKDGKYKWIMDQGDALPFPMDAPEMIMAKVADCPPGYRGKSPKPAKVPPAPFDPALRAGKSDDGTLTWTATVAPDNARRFIVTMVSAGQPVTVQDLQVEAPAR
ncbi:hypothetical protein ACFFF7_11930 [Novosphingobium aquiterrae]|uniref:DUF4440 domain-containing protein n=1 Tax=Novosphingobium aquiterrae TaxID=624388 RepID=A0ABV6PL65_9SPHN